jgi:hypothetical protein
MRVRFVLVLLIAAGALVFVLTRGDTGSEPAVSTSNTTAVTAPPVAPPAPSTTVATSAPAAPVAPVAPPTGGGTEFSGSIVDRFRNG